MAYLNLSLQKKWMRLKTEKLLKGHPMKKTLLLLTTVLFAAPAMQAATWKERLKEHGAWVGTAVAGLATAGVSTKMIHSYQQQLLDLKQTYTIDNFITWLQRDSCPLRNDEIKVISHFIRQYINNPHYTCTVQSVTKGVDAIGNSDLNVWWLMTYPPKKEAIVARIHEYKQNLGLNFDKQIHFFSHLRTVGLTVAVLVTLYGLNKLYTTKKAKTNAEKQPAVAA